MNHVTVTLGSDVHAKLLRGVNTIAEPVSSTLGPGGLAVLIEHASDTAAFTLDGTSVADAVQKLADPVEDLGAQTVRRAARKTVADAGDGTTTTTVLLRAMFAEGCKRLAAGQHAVEVAREVRADAAKVEGALREMAVPVDAAIMRHVAAVSTHGDRMLGDLVARAVEATGNTGYISVAPGETTTVEVVTSYVFQRPLLDASFAKNKDGTTDLSHPAVCVSSVPMSLRTDIKPLLKLAGARPLVLIAPVLGEAVAACKANDVVCVSSAGVDLDALEDLAVAIGAQVLRQGVHTPATVVASDLSFTVTNFTAGPRGTFFVGTRDEGRLERHIASIDPKAMRRLAALRGKVATIYLAATTEAGWSHAKDLVDDAIGACRSAFRSGVLPGGGIALARLSGVLDAGSVTRVALTEPLKRIAKNAGKSGEAVLDRVLANPHFTYGYDARAHAYGDIVEVGIIDPLEVTLAALRNAAEFAALLLTTAATVHEVKG
jgi:chaperonin GroEL